MNNKKEKMRKKIVLFITAVMLCFCLMASFVIAAPPGSQPPSSPHREEILSPRAPAKLFNIEVFEPGYGKSCVIGSPCSITWNKTNIQNYPTVWLEIVWPDGTPTAGAYPVSNNGYYYDWKPDPSFADPSVLCKELRIKIYTPDNKYKGMSGLFKVGNPPNGCTW